MALSRPPMTPAMAMGPAASAMTTFEGERAYFSSFSATMRLAGAGGPRQMVSPVSFARSKACIGCASSAMM